MWHVAPKSKTQLVICELSPKSPLGLSIFVDICAIGNYILFDSYCSILFPMSCLISSIFTHIFWLIPIPGDPLFLIFWFQTICDKVILWSASETYIWIYIVVFITFTIALINIWNGILLPFYFIFCLKHLSFGWEPPQWVRFDWEN